MKQKETGKRSSSAAAQKKAASSTRSRRKSSAKEEQKTPTNKRRSGFLKRPPPNNKKRSGATKAQPPFPLFEKASEASGPDGFEAVVNLLRGRKNIVVLTGAGISVSCGIPDFRSKGSGLYSTLDAEVCKAGLLVAQLVSPLISSFVLLRLFCRALVCHVQKNFLIGKYFRKTHGKSCRIYRGYFHRR
jgi:hypothetical protein